MKYFFYVIFLLFSLLWADELTTDPPTIWPTQCLPCRPAPAPPLPICDFEDNVVVDLIDPIYTEGVLSTDSGGVLVAPDLRIQAQSITYTRILDGLTPIFTVSCSGNLVIDYKEWVLVGDSLYYDFTTRRGFLINGKTAAPPWYIGGREILLLEEGLVILDGLITTSEGEIEDISLRASQICLSPDKIISISNVTARVNRIPVFWFPKLQFDLNNIGQSPFGVRFGWGGFTGSYVSLLYRFLSWRELKATARLDAFFGKGFGAGIETVYNPCWRPTQFYTRNYYALDIPLLDPERKNRYRFQGTFYDRIYGVTINGMYDFVSDAEMASDYNTKDFELKTAGKTQLELRRKYPSLIANLFATVRVNDFQSVNQELPTLQLNWRPVEIPATGIIFENTLKASYLDYVFSDDVENATDFSSGRFAYCPFFYRPFFLGPCTVTPEAGLIGIAYSNTPSGGSAGQAVGEFGVKLETALAKCSTSWKHTVEPYIHYRHLTAPQVNIDHHYIFTINDGLDRLNVCRFGVRNSFFIKVPCGIERPLWIDLWANAFFATPTIPLSIPKVYWNVEWLPNPFVFIGMEGAYHFAPKQIDFYNVRLDWTINDHLAFGTEYRYRSRFDWRKADFYNFILESARSQTELLDSPLSEKCHTVLFRMFSRITPNWSVKCDLRYGWDLEGFNPLLDIHVKQKPFLEYQIDLTRVIFQHWRLTFSYDKRVAENRFSFALLLDPGPPPKRKACL